MEKIKIEKFSEQELKDRNVFNWPIWEKEVSRFDWHYDSIEQCYILEGKVRVESKDGEPVEFGAGDFVTFSEGLDCTWDISQGVRKHYNFG